LALRLTEERDQQRVAEGFSTALSDPQPLVRPTAASALRSAAGEIPEAGTKWHARVLIVALQNIGLNVSGLLAGLGIGGLAFALAAKDTLANLFAGIFILADAPYKLGDFVILDNGERGRVTDIGIRTTRLLTQDDIEITIPNAVIANSRIVNETGGPHEKERVRVTVSVAYGSDVDRVRAVLLECAKEVDHVCTEPAPRVRFREFGDSGLKFQLLAWIDEPVLRGRVLDDLHTRVYKRFNEEQIEIPYAKHDVYIKQMPGS